MLVPALLLVCCLLASLSCLLFLFLWVAVYRAPATTTKASLGRSAAVVVLGDVGRSPRMCYHVESLANEGWKVAVVGYKGTLPPPPLRRPSIRHHYLRTPPKFIARLPRAAFAFAAPFKVLLQSAALFWELTARVQPPPEVVLVQTPPALPTLFVVRLVSLLLGSRVIVDWHNLGYTILALRMGEKSPLVRVAEWLERLTGKSAFAHLFVTRAMMGHLDQKWKLKGKKVVLHDRPPLHFRRSTVQETHRLFCSLVPRLTPSVEEFLPSYTAPNSTPMTVIAAENPPSPRETQSDLRPDSPVSPPRQATNAGCFAQPRDDRPALVVSSTSWTADEDFELLLRAATLYERRARELASAAGQTGGLSSALRSQRARESRRPSIGSLRTSEPAKILPKMLLVVTGRGELRANYERQIAKLETEEKWEWVRIRTAWLESEEYPVLLGSADIGVSLHTSSSGLDLPMKVVDMLGCGLPVCALDFACLDELIQDGRNGLVFRDAEGLANQFESLLANFPAPSWLLSNLGHPFNPPTPPSAGGVYSSPPSPATPYASFSLLASPVIGPLLPGTAQNAQGLSHRTDTWQGNWKHVVRPLLLSEDDPTDSCSGRNNTLSPSSSSSYFKSHARFSSSSASASISERQGLLTGFQLNTSPRSSIEGGEEYQDPVQDEGFSGLDRAGRLRHRRSIHRHGTGGSNASQVSDIPDIQVSPAGV